MDRNTFLKKSALGGFAFGYSDKIFGETVLNPKDAYSRPSDLKITDIRGATIAANYDYPIIKIYTNQGITGLGEVRDAGWIAQALIMKPYLIGKDPLDIETILMSIRHLTGHGRYAGGYAAIDIALMDIAGKALGVPCWKLLGEKLRDEVEVYADCPTVKDLNDLKVYMKRRLDAGFKHYKLDLTPPLLKDIEGAIINGLPTRKGLEIWGEHVKIARNIIGYDVKLGADHFGKMTVETGIALGEYMADSKFGLAYIEDVVNFGEFNSVIINRQITQGSPTPTLGFEDIFGLDGFKPFIEQRAIDIIHPDMLTSGGMLETKKIADYAALFGINTMVHCACSPIGAMAMIHTIATMNNFISLENHAMEMPWWADLVAGNEKPVIKNGIIKVPTGPGLGIELNDQVVKGHLREPKYLSYNPGLFDPTPAFDLKMSMREAKEKGLIGPYHQTGGPHWHINDKGEYANQLFE
jgi:L-alanine-DL-glutamate epimerase-like enolase superfamily enzyme